MYPCFAGGSDFERTKLELLLPACGFGECQKIATVMPEGLPGTCQSIFLGFSDGQIGVDTSEAADTARKTTLIQIGAAAGSFLALLHAFLSHCTSDGTKERLTYKPKT